MDRQVKKDISIGTYNQENIRLLFQSPDSLSGQHIILPWTGEK